MFESHSLSPISLESISAFALITEIGVLSSWLASEMNCFCLLSFSASGLIISLDIKSEIKKRTTSALVPTIRKFLISMSMLLLAKVLSKNATSVYPGRVLTTNDSSPI